jgi:branched-chain amino acid transport system permease protein
LSAIEFYALTLGVFACVSAIEALAFNIQFGFVGIVNIAFIVLVAAGAYGTAIAELPPARLSGQGVSYLGGFGWSFWPSLLFGTVVSAIFGCVLGLIMFSRLRHDYLALALVAFGQGVLVLITDEPSLFNGTTGLTGIPGPTGVLVITADSQIVFMVVSAIALVIVFALLHRVTASPFGRALRALREEESAAVGVGKNALALKLKAFVLGSAVAGLAGGLLATYVGGWSPQAWQLNESFIVLAAVIVGGRARHSAAVLGAVVVMVGITQASQYIPNVLPAGVVPDLGAILVGVLIIGFLAWRPEGLLPERKEYFKPSRAVPIVGEDPVSSRASSKLGGLKLASELGARVKSLGHAGADADWAIGESAADSPRGTVPALQITDLHCSYGGVQAVRGISFKVAAGSFVGLIGPNGAGKSTLVDCLSGFNRNYSGRVVVFGQDISRQPPYKIARKSLLRGFQDARVFAKMTSIENVSVAPLRQRGETVMGALRGAWRPQETHIRRQSLELLERFQLELVTNSYADELSGGQRRLLELARLLVSGPRFIVLDEPFVGISPANRDRLCTLLSSLCAEHDMTVLMVEHRLELVERLCDSVLVMAEGQLIAEGSMGAVRQQENVRQAYLGSYAG